MDPVALSVAAGFHRSQCPRQMWFPQVFEAGIPASWDAAVAVAVAIRCGAFGAPTLGEATALYRWHRHGRHESR